MLSAPYVAAARREMEDAAFKRDRLQAAVTKLGVRLGELRAQEENDRRTANYARVMAMRDNLAAELANIYPGIERQLVDLFTRLDDDKESTLVFQPTRNAFGLHNWWRVAYPVW